MKTRKATIESLTSDLLERYCNLEAAIVAAYETGRSINDDQLKSLIQSAFRFQCVQEALHQMVEPENRTQMAELREIL